MARFTPTGDLADVLHDLLAASSYNRELNRLAKLLDALSARVEAFADLNPALELVDGLVARGVGRATASVEVTEFLDSADGPDAPQEAARALAWVLRTVSMEMRGVALRVPGARRG